MAMTLRNLCFLSFVMVLVGCATAVPLQRDQIASISRDTSPTELESILAKGTPLHQFEFQANSLNYFARDYSLQTGTRPDIIFMCSPTCLAIPVSTPIFSDYVVIQSLPSKTVAAWGTIEELSKDSDVNISGLMPVVKERLADLQKKK